MSTCFPATAADLGPRGGLRDDAFLLLKPLVCDLAALPPAGLVGLDPHTPSGMCWCVSPTPCGGRGGEARCLRCRWGGQGAWGTACGGGLSLAPQWKGRALSRPSRHQPWGRREAQCQGVTIGHRRPLTSGHAAPLCACSVPVAMADTTLCPREPLFLSEPSRTPRLHQDSLRKTSLPSLPRSHAEPCEQTWASAVT